MVDRSPRLARIAVYPIKSLDALEPRRAGVVKGGALEHDREYAIVDEDGDYVNGKRTADVHRLRARFDDALETVSVRRESATDSDYRKFDLDADRSAFEGWLTEYFGYPVSLIRDSDGGFPDDATLSGPTVISTATLRETASWFDGIDVESMRRRTRANLEIAGVPPFWEDRLVSDFDHEVAVRIGDVTLRGVNPCQRCVVPSRDPDTGEPHDGFERTFVENRERTLPDWVNETRFDHYFRLMVNTVIERSDWGSQLEVGDDVEILGERPAIDRSRS